MAKKDAKLQQGRYKAQLLHDQGLTPLLIEQIAREDYSHDPHVMQGMIEYAQEQES